MVACYTPSAYSPKDANRVSANRSQVMLDSASGKRSLFSPLLRQPHSPATPLSVASLKRYRRPEAEQPLLLHPSWTLAASGLRGCVQPVYSLRGSSRLLERPRSWLLFREP